ncbi:MAG TPA: hypothetical protein PK413_14820 [Thermoanaerobaculia bacterium]|nr:hypothetical protein [Thermoanaerobaculia bacterium]
MTASRFDFGEFTGNLVEQVFSAVLAQAEGQLRAWTELIEQARRPVAELLAAEATPEEEQAAEEARARLQALLAAGLPRISVTAGEIETRVTFSTLTAAAAPPSSRASFCDAVIAVSDAVFPAVA